MDQPWKPSPATIRFKRCTSYYVDKQTKNKYNKREYEKWYKDFADMDKNEDGIVVKEEFMSWMKETDPVAFGQDEKCKEMWEKIVEADTDGDGELSWDEFILQMIKSGYLQPLPEKVK